MKILGFALTHWTLLQVDLDMLNVSLGTGTLEIHSALLNTDYLDAQLVSADLAASVPCCNEPAAQRCLKQGMPVLCSSSCMASAAHLQANAEIIPDVCH